MPSWKIILKVQEELKNNLQKQVGVSRIMVAKALKEISFSKDQEMRLCDRLKALLALSKMFGWDEPKEEEDDGKFKGNLIVQFGIKEYELLPDNENDIVDFTKDEQ